MTTNDSGDELKDIIITAINCGSINVNSRNLHARKAKAAILANYISKDDVLAAIGVDERHPSTLNPTIMVSSPHERDRNDLRAEIRKKLNITVDDGEGKV